MPTLAARHIAKSFGGQVVLDDVSVTVGPSARLAVVGPNGIGKSTLLRLLAGVDEPDRGSVTRTPATLNVGYLPQEPEGSAGESVLGHLARRTGVAGAEQALVAEAAALAADGGSAAAESAYAAALERFLVVGGTDFEARAATILSDLGLPGASLHLDVGRLSGGQAARVSLAAILLSRADVLLLDEPTNNLDVDGLERLERFVAATPAGVVVVSHDRAFLDHTVTRVLELEEGTRGARAFGGGWAAYMADRETARRQQYEAHDRGEEERARLAEQARRQTVWAEGGARRARRRPEDKDKYLRHSRAEGAENLATRARLLERRMARVEVPDKPWEGWELRLTLPSTAKIGAVAVRLERAVVERGRFRLGPVDLEVAGGERVAIVGSNGSGKTTLLGALLGELPIAAGRRWAGPGVVTGEIEQARSTFAGTAPLLERFVARSGLVPEQARSLLAKLGLAADHVHRPADTLSPGERTRAALGLLWSGGVNVLALDEPTNHLDLPAIEQLEVALDDYDGTLLLVTHDRRLLEAVRITRTVRLDAGRLVGEEDRRAGTGGGVASGDGLPTGDGGRPGRRRAGRQTGCP